MTTKPNRFVTFSLSDKEKLESGYYNIVFAHPESLVSCTYGRKLMPIPENRLFAQFHSPQTKEMKDQILKQLCSSDSTVRVIFATVALGMGVDIQGIRHIVHITPPHTIQAYFQETGRDIFRKPVLFYNNHDIAKNKPGMQEDVRRFCQSQGECLRHLLLSLLDTDKKHFSLVSPKHLCCGVGKLECDCHSCTQ